MIGEKHRVIIVDDHPIFRQGVRAILEATKDIEVVGEAADGQRAIALAESLTPDIMLMDINLPGLNGLEVARVVKRRQPQTAIIILSVNEDDEQLFNSIKVGAAHYSSKDITQEQLVSIVRLVSQGHYLINENVLSKPLVASRVLNQFRELAMVEDEGGTIFAPLTGREVEILDCIARGMSNKQIAHDLSISDQTVKNHITSILKKLQVNDRTQAVVYAFKHGWIKVPEGD
ncbi:MAG: DNA-binding response regulator [Candidatus Chloroheliales bacterium]|nr:MAG: DNA-binding response regulator [Chloroflexota bacterium]